MALFDKPQVRSNNVTISYCFRDIRPHHFYRIHALTRWWHIPNDIILQGLAMGGGARSARRESNALPGVAESAQVSVC